MQDKWGFPRNENKHTHRHRFDLLELGEPQHDEVEGGDSEDLHRVTSRNTSSRLVLTGTSAETDTPCSTSRLLRAAGDTSP